MAAPNARFTQREIDAIARAYNLGFRAEQIGERLGVSRQRVFALLRRSSLYRPRPRHR